MTTSTVMARRWRVHLRREAPRHTLAGEGKHGIGRLSRKNCQPSPFLATRSRTGKASIIKAMLKAVVGAASLASAAAFAPMPSGLNLAAAHRPAVCGLELRHGGCSLRMANANEDEMEELMKKRVELLKEQEELLKQRKAIANRNKQSNDGQVPELQRPKEPPMAAKRADDLFKSVPSGNIFEGGDKKADADGKRGAKQDGQGVVSRGGFLRTLVVSFGFSVLTLVSAFVLSYPRLEKLAYVQFGALFENGSIILRKQLYQAIEGEDWDAVMKLTGTYHAMSECAKRC